MQKKTRITENSIRLFCTAGAPVVVVRSEKEVDKQLLSNINAAGIFIASDIPIETAQRIIEKSDTVMFHEFVDAERYEELCEAYLECYTHKSYPAILGGPGMITVLPEPQGIDNYFQTVKELEKRLANRTGQKINFLPQPLVVKVNDTKTLDNAVSLHERNRIEGVLFNDHQLFRACKQKDALFALFMGDIDKITEIGHEFDGYIINQIPSQKKAKELIHIRVEKIAQRYNQPLFTSKDKNRIRIGVVALQGAYFLEKALLESLQPILPYDIEIILVHTKEEMTYLDGIILGGGWHIPQYHLYNDRSLKIFGGIQELVHTGGHILFSCAGAILARNSQKSGEGCFPESFNLMDYGVINNKINGVRKFPIAGKTKQGVFVGAPQFVELGKNLEDVVYLDDKIAISVTKTNKNGSILTATSVHNRSIILRWLNKIAKKDIDRLDMVEKLILLEDMIDD